MKVYRQWVPCERISSYNFIPIFLKLCTCFAMVWRCACGLNIILELILSLFPLCELRHFLTSDSMEVYRQWVPCKRNSLYNFMPVFIQLCTSFCPWFEDVYVDGINPAVNFCHLSTLLSCHFRRCDINFTDVRSFFYIFSIRYRHVIGYINSFRFSDYFLCCSSVINMTVLSFFGFIITELVTFMEKCLLLVVFVVFRF